MSGSPFENEAEWHALRAANVGGSECAALFDCQPAYALSKFALWHVKAGLAPPPKVEGERIQWGLRLEAAIANAAAEQEGWTIRKGGYVTDPTTNGMGCTLDYIIDAPGENDEDCNGPGLLEVKNSDWLQHKNTWTDEEPPMHILLQFMHQAGCTGYSWGAVACLIGGNKLNIYRYKVRPKLISEIRRRVKDFWQSIEDGKPPAVDASESATAVLKSVYPVLYDEELDLSTNNEFSEICAEMLKWAEVRKDAVKHEDLEKNRLRALMGDYKRASGNGYRVSISVTPEKAPREPKPGELISGRAETRRFNVKEIA